MTMPIVKICGLSTPDTLDAALVAGARMVGLMFFAKSPRNVSLDVAAKLSERARKRAEVVAVTVDADDALIEQIIFGVRPDWLQLHGAETPDRCLALRRRHGVKVMKALGISGQDDIAAARAYSGSVDRLLFDAKPPKDAVLPGGNGVAFDWTLLRGLDLGIPVMLSGGLSPKTVAEAIKISGVAAVDVSSGVERVRGVKDETLIRDFVAAAHAAAREEREQA